MLVRKELLIFWIKYSYVCIRACPLKTFFLAELKKSSASPTSALKITPFFSVSARHSTFSQSDGGPLGFLTGIDWLVFTDPLAAPRVPAAVFMVSLKFQWQKGLTV